MVVCDLEYHVIGLKTQCLWVTYIPILGFHNYQAQDTVPEFINEGPMGVTDLIQNKSVVYFNQKYNISNLPNLPMEGEGKRCQKS